MITLAPVGFYQFQILKKFPELRQGISTKKFGDMRSTASTPRNIKNPETFFEKSHEELHNLMNFTQQLGVRIGNFAIPEQVHGGQVEEVILGPYRDTTGELFIQSVDGLVVDKKGLFLLVMVADCYPILAYDRQEQIIGIAHAGWRGVKAEIAKNLILKMKDLRAKSENIVAGVGPGICVNHYEVKSDIAAKFSAKGGPANGWDFFVRNGKKVFLDLEKAIIYQLRNSGVRKENIEMAGVCVFENENFFSARRDKTEDRFVVLIGMTE